MARMKKRLPGDTPKAIGGGLSGMHLFDPKLQVDLVKPDWNKKKLPLVAHVVASIRNADEYGKPVKPHFEPYRFEAGTDTDSTNGYNSFYMRAAVANMVGIGDHKKTFIVADTVDKEDVDESFYVILYNRIHRAVLRANKEGTLVWAGKKKYDPAKWNGLLPGERTNYETTAFIKPTRMLHGFMSLLPLIDRGEITAKAKTDLLPGSGSGDRPRVAMMSSSATQAFEAALATPADPDAAAGADEWEAIYKYGDITRFAGGKWMVIYNAEHHDGASLLGMGASAPTEDEEEVDIEEGFGNNKYTVEFSSRIFLATKGKRVELIHDRYLARSSEQAILANYRPVDEMLYVPSPDEQALILAKAYQTRPELLLYGFADTPDFFTDEVNAFLAKRVQVTVGSVATSDESATDDIEADDDDIEIDPDDIVSEDVVDTDEDEVSSVFPVISADDDDDDLPPFDTESPSPRKTVSKEGTATATRTVKKKKRRRQSVDAVEPAERRRAIVTKPQAATDVPSGVRRKRRKA